jgi:ankyrin repeat protein
MSNSQLPERASLEYLKKLAKDRLHELRRADPQAKLASALLDVARDHGFSSWRALKAEIEQRQKKFVTYFFEACAKGDVEAMRGPLQNDPALVSASIPGSFHGWTGLHEAAKRGHAEAVRLLLEYGADPNARESGDNTYALHWAAAQGHLEIVRALLDAGGDVHGMGDVHEFDVIGWATYHAPGDAPAQMDVSRRGLVSLLLERGARHHIFSAMSVGDLELIRRLVEQNPEMLDRRMSRFEQGMTPLHFAMGRKRYDILDVLIELGADLEAQDQSGQTALAVAMLRGDRGDGPSARGRSEAAEGGRAVELHRRHGQIGWVRQERCPDDLRPGCRAHPRLVHFDRIQRDQPIRRRRCGELRHGSVRRGRTHAQHARKTRPARRESMVLYRQGR